jgi:hypothetical protein
VSKAVLQDALSYLVQTGNQRAIETVARAHFAHHGAIEPTLAGIVEVRLSELERLTAARPRIGL